MPIIAQTADLRPIDGSVRLRCARRANIGRYDLLDCFRLDVEALEARQGPARHAVHPEKINLACGQRRARQQLEHLRQDLDYREGHRDQQPPPADNAQSPAQDAQSTRLALRERLLRPQR